MFFFIMLTLTLSVNTILFTVTGAISPVIVNVYTNGSVYTNRCYKALSVYFFQTPIACIKVCVDPNQVFSSTVSLS